MSDIRDKLDFSGKTVLVSGASASKGIGATMARAFHRLGAFVINVDVADGAGLIPNNYAYYPCDTTDEAAVVSALARAAKSGRGLDVLVNNVGIIAKAEMESFDMASFRRVMDVNTVSAAMLTKHCVPLLKMSLAGRIVNIASVQAHIGTPVYSAYAASKAAICGLTRVWAMELMSHNVTVNAISPGFVHTDMFERGAARIMEERNVSRDEAIAAIVAPCPQKRPIQPEEVADMAVFLASGAAQGLTGQTLHLDGGMTTN